jgi:hypothetical protein
MKDIKDGEHHRAKAVRDLTSVLVTPLDPAHGQDVSIFHFAGPSSKPLAVSREDGAKITALMAGLVKGRHVVLSAVDNDSQMIRVSISQ